MLNWNNWHWTKTRTILVLRLTRTMYCKNRFVQNLKALKKNPHADQGSHWVLFPNLTKWFQRTFGNIKTGVEFYFQIWITKCFQRTFGNIITGVEFYFQIFNNGQNHKRTLTLVTQRHLHECCTLATDIRVEMVAKRSFSFFIFGSKWKPEYSDHNHLEG